MSDVTFFLIFVVLAAFVAGAWWIKEWAIARATRAAAIDRRLAWKPGKPS